MPNYRIVELNCCQFIIEIEKVSREGFWPFRYFKKEWVQCNIEGGIYGENFKEEDVPFWFFSKVDVQIPRLKSFTYREDATRKIKEFEGHQVINSILEVA